MNIYEKSIHKKIENIARIYNLDKILNFKIDNKYIQKYYLVNKIPYSIFHSRKNYVHFAVNKNGKYSEDGLNYQPKFVAKYIKKIQTQNVLEIACGRAANLTYLANKFPQVNFFGIDLSKAQLSLAFKKLRKYNNLKVEQGDYHNLSKFKSHSFDIVFVVEALCYSTNEIKVFAEVNRILKPSGLFIIIDGYWNDLKEKTTRDNKIAKRLSELGIALNKYGEYEQIEKYANKTGFVNIEKNNLIQYLLPNAEKFEKMAKIVFEKKCLAFPIKYLFPKKFIYNAFFGYLIADTIRVNWCQYVFSVFQKSKNI